MPTAFSVRSRDLEQDTEQYIITNYTCELDGNTIKVRDSDSNILWLQPHDFNLDGSIREWSAENEGVSAFQENNSHTPE
jgi:hypothetical protein